MKINPSIHERKSVGENVRISMMREEASDIKSNE